MLRESNYIIAKKIDLGHYFRDTFEWYATKHMYFYTFRAYLAIMLIFVCVGLGFMYLVSQMTFVVKSYPFPIYALDETKYFPIMKPISTEKESINISVARYLVGKYVLLREEYKFAEQSGEAKAILEQKIRNLSSFKIFRNYLNYMDPDFNSDSPLISYKNHTQRIIKITKVELTGNPFRPDAAEVAFQAEERGVFGESVSTWKAEVDFNMSDIEKIFKKQSRLSFVVTRYNTYKQ
jgi:type IV secretory pathway component VirB8